MELWKTKHGKNEKIHVQQEGTYVHASAKRDIKKMHENVIQNKVNDYSSALKSSKKKKTYDSYGLKKAGRCFG